MKNIVLTLFLAVASLNCAVAEVHHQLWDFYVTPHAGAAFSKMNSNLSSWKYGAAGGLGFEIFISNHTSLGIDLNYTHQGSNEVYHWVNGVHQGPYDYRLDYINFDYLLKWYPLDYVDFYAGLHMGRLVNAKREYDGWSKDIEDDLHSGNFTVPVGMNVNLGNFTVDGRFYFPFNKLVMKNRADNLLHPHTRDVTVMVTVGYKIKVL